MSLDDDDDVRALVQYIVTGVYKTSRRLAGSGYNNDVNACKSILGIFSQIRPFVDALISIFKI